MKTVEEIAIKISSGIGDPQYSTNAQIKYTSRVLNEFEKEIRADERNTRIKELDSIGEFKTDAEAQEYCRLHGLDIHTTIGNLFRIAGALMDARKDKDKITRQACAEILNNCERMWSGEYRVDSWIDLDDAHQAIMDM